MANPSPSKIVLLVNQDRHGRNNTRVTEVQERTMHREKDPKIGQSDPTRLEQVTKTVTGTGIVTAIQTETAKIKGLSITEMTTIVVTSEELPKRKG